MNEIDYGPLKQLLGKWTGDKGMDIAPEPDGPEQNPYYESIEFVGIGDATNAEKQTLAVVRYHQVVKRLSNDEIFHDEVGYWMWDAAEKVVMHSLTIPRAVAVLAGGHHDGDATTSVKLSVSAKLGDADWGIIQSPFMRDNAKTVAFQHDLTVEGDKMFYKETTSLEIYGKSFEHKDANELMREDS